MLWLGNEISIISFVWGYVWYGDELHNGGRAGPVDSKCQKDQIKTQYEFHLRPKREPMQVCLAVEPSRVQLKCLRGLTGDGLHDDGRGRSSKQGRHPSEEISFQTQTDCLAVEAFPLV